MFGVDLTWVGLVFIVLLFLGTMIQFVKGVVGMDTHTSAGESFFAAIINMAFIVGFFTVGFVK